MWYYTLLVRDDSNDSWRIEFGDYNHKTVKEEGCDYIENGEFLARDVTILTTTTDKQSDIDNAVNELNRKN